MVQTKTAPKVDNEVDDAFQEANKTVEDKLEDAVTNNDLVGNTPLDDLDGNRTSFLEVANRLDRKNPI